MFDARRTRPGAAGRSDGLLALLFKGGGRLAPSPPTCCGYHLKPWVTSASVTGLVTTACSRSRRKTSPRLPLVRRLKRDKQIHAPNATAPCTQHTRARPETSAKTHGTFLGRRALAPSRFCCPYYILWPQELTVYPLYLDIAKYRSRLGRWPVLIGITGFYTRTFRCR